MHSNPMARRIILTAAVVNSDNIKKRNGKTFSVTPPSHQHSYSAFPIADWGGTARLAFICFIQEALYVPPETLACHLLGDTK